MQPVSAAALPGERPWQRAARNVARWSAIALGFSIGAGNAANLTQSAPVAPAGWLLALIPVMFTYSGWNAAAYVAEEIREPGRNVPRALALGTGAVIVIYLLLNVLYLYVFPADQLAAVRGSVLDVIADRLLGSIRSYGYHWA